MKSFFKSLKKKSSNRDSAVPPSPFPPFTGSKVRLDLTEHSDTPSPSSSSSSVSTIQVPVVRLQIARSSSQDTFNSSVDDVLTHGKAASRASPAPIPDQRFLSPARHPYSDIHCVAMPPSPPPRSPLNSIHGPPRNRKHGPPNVLEAQMTSINATKASPTRGGYFSPAHGQFTEPLSQQKARTIRFEASPSPIPHEAKLPQSRGRILSDEHHVQSGGFQQLHKNTNSSSHTPEHASTGSLNARTLHPSRSSPHLPSSGRQTPLEPEDLSSLFPSPPPLIIRKRVPQPLVLQPRRPSAGSIVPSSPDPSSSTESTPVSTPTSPKQFSPPTQSPPSSKTYARHGNGIPPLLYDPPTSPLPSPPVNPHPKTPIPRFQGRVHLRGAQSSANLRSNGSLTSPTHRMTSSDPVSEFLQQLGLEGHHSCSPLPQFESDQDTEITPQFSRTHRNAPVRWGYAL